MYVHGSVPAHNEELMPEQDDGRSADEHQDAFDHELVEKPQAYFPADDAGEDAEGADAAKQS